MRLLLCVLCSVSFNFFTTRCDPCSTYPSTFNFTLVRWCVRGQCVKEYLDYCLSNRKSERVTFLSKVTSLEGGAIRNMSALRFLNISGVDLQGIEPFAFHDLPEISRILLRGNSITVIKNNVFQDTFAEYIDLSYNRIHHLEDHAFSNMSKLKVLKINNNHIKSMNRRLFTRSPNIEALNFARNEITTLDLNMLLPISFITILDVNFNKIFEVMPDVDVSTCNTLLLGGNNLERVNFLGTLRVKRLNLAMNSLTHLYFDFLDLVKAGTEFFVHPNP